jgi:signal peptidase I
MKTTYADLILHTLQETGRVRTSFAGRSMWPTLDEGMQILVEKIKPKDIKLGEIILYRKENSLVVHRVMRIFHKDNKNFFITKGDHGVIIDTVPEEHLFGIITVAFHEKEPQKNILIRSRLLGILYVIIGNISIPYLRNKEKLPKFMAATFGFFFRYAYSGAHHGQMFLRRIRTCIQT